MEIGIDGGEPMPDEQHFQDMIGELAFQIEVTANMIEYGLIELSHEQLSHVAWEDSAAWVGVAEKGRIHSTLGLKLERLGDSRGAKLRSLNFIIEAKNLKEGDKIKFFYSNNEVAKFFMEFEYMVGEFAFQIELTANAIKFGSIELSHDQVSHFVSEALLEVAEKGCIHNTCGLKLERLGDPNPRAAVLHCLGFIIRAKRLKEGHIIKFFHSNKEGIEFFIEVEKRRRRRGS